MSACLASLLEVPISEVPNFFSFFDSYPEPGEWWEKVREFLRRDGMSIISMSFTDAKQWRMFGFEGYQIVGGKSHRGHTHATIWKDGIMVHDPHPDGTGLVAPETLDVLYLIDASQNTKRAYSRASERADERRLTLNTEQRIREAIEKMSWTNPSSATYLLYTLEGEGVLTRQRPNNGVARSV